MPIIDPLAPNTPQPRGDAFVQAVLNATLLALAETGYAQLSIPAVAQSAGVNKTSIYRRWPDKAALVRAALEVAMRHTDAAPNTGTLRGDLIALAGTVAAFTQSPLGTAIIRIMLAEGGNPEVRALASAAYQQAGKNGPFEVLTRAIQRGELKRQEAGPILLFTIAGAIMHRVFVEREAASESFIVQLVDLVLYGAAANG